MSDKIAGLIIDLCQRCFLPWLSALSSIPLPNSQHNSTSYSIKFNRLYYTAQVSIILKLIVTTICLFQMTYIKTHLKTNLIYQNGMTQSTFREESIAWQFWDKGKVNAIIGFMLTDFQVSGKSEWKRNYKLKSKIVSIFLLRGMHVEKL